MRDATQAGTPGGGASPGLGNFVTHASRTMMLSELALLLEVVPMVGSSEDYRNAVLDENVLLKGAATTRAKSLRHLRELYALDGADVRFATLRTLWGFDSPSRPLLALLCAVQGARRILTR